MHIKGLMLTTLVGACFAISPAIAQESGEASHAAVEQAADMAADAAKDAASEAGAVATEQAADIVPEAAMSSDAGEVDVTPPAAEVSVVPPAAQGMADAAGEADAKIDEVAQEAGEPVQAESEEQISAESVEPMAEMTEAEAEAAPAGPEGMWLRDNGNQVKVEFRDGAMYCTIINRTKRNGKPKKDFEMCHGMTANGDTWTGRKMKHPEMPGFMTFKGTVSMADDVISIKGCAVGVCDSESWTRMPAQN